MRTKILTAAILAASTLAPMANAADGTINFTGTILDAACTVDAGSAAQIIPLGTVSKAGFVNSGDVASSHDIKITISACDTAITRAAVRFDGLRDANDTRLLGLTSAGTAGVATGVGVAIFENDGTTLIPLGSKSAGMTIAPPAGGDLTYVAKYMASTDAAGITGGTANAVATFTMDYE